MSLWTDFRDTALGNSKNIDSQEVVRSVGEWVNEEAPKVVAKVATAQELANAGQARADAPQSIVQRITDAGASALENANSLVKDSSAKLGIPALVLVGVAAWLLLKKRK